jgi:hypothetical protein
MRKIVSVMSPSSFLFAGRNQAAVPPAAPPSAARTAHGWICVHNGTPELLQQAIEDYASNLKKLKPKEFRVRVARHPAGFLAVMFPDGVPPYDLVNLIGWLNQPPGMEAVSGAVGWITSPASSKRYSLQPDSGNEFGDTLIGMASDGETVQVYQPDAAMCEVSRRVILLPEPDTSMLSAGSGITFSVALDADASFGNPDFKTTHPKDTNWN